MAVYEGWWEMGVWGGGVDSAMGPPDIDKHDFGHCVAHNGNVSLTRFVGKTDHNTALPKLRPSELSRRSL